VWITEVRRRQSSKFGGSKEEDFHNMSHALWQCACDRLAAELPEQQFNTWIRPLTVTVAEIQPSTAPACAPTSNTDAPSTAANTQQGPRCVVSLRVPNRFKLDWIRAQYLSRIEALLAELAEGPVRVELIVVAPAARAAEPTDARDGMAVPATAQTNTAAMALRRGSAVAAASVALDALGAHHETPGQATRPALGGATSPTNRGGYGPGGLRSSAPAANPYRLNPALTFDTLVGGRANQMARTAALHVAGAPGAMYNPLFIYGGVGLGKTHLVHAVGNALLQDRSDARVLYLHAEQFISDVVKNYQRKTFDELKSKYHSLDLLLIDDVQFFAGKERTQEEFFNTFEALLSKRAHIIMTSDTYPKGLVDIDERLTSRFDAGLTVAMEPPELEMRVAILMRKATAEATEMPEDVAFFIAKNVRANVRELEGALRKVLAYSRFSHKDINITLAREALKDLLSIQNRQIGVENIQKTVADFYKIKVADMYSKKRPASIARPRQIAMYLAKDMTKKSLPEIGELFGGRDHTTVLHAVRKIGAERTTNPELNQQLHVLEQTLKG
jgi:chromosomal replication initiator protein